MAKKIQRKHIVALLMAFVLLFTVVNLSGSIILFGGTIGDGHSSCPFMEHSQSLCSMGPIDHIVHWQEMFVSLPAEFISLSLLAIAFAVIAAVLFVGQSLSAPRMNARLYIRASQGVSRYNYFVRLFSKGILHSKIYA